MRDGLGEAASKYRPDEERIDVKSKDKKEKPELTIIDGGKKSYDSSIFLDEADRSTALQELERNKAQLGDDYERMRESVSNRKTFEQLKKETGPSKIALTRKQYEDLKGKIDSPSKLQRETFVDETPQRIDEAEMFDVEDIPGPPPMPSENIMNRFNRRLEDLHQSNIPSEQFAAEFLALNAERTLDLAKRSKYEAEQSSASYTPAEISERKYQYLENKIFTETSDPVVAAKKMMEIDQLLDVKEPEKVEKKPVLATSEEIEEVFNRNKGKEKVRITVENYDALIQEINTATKTPEEMIAKTENLDNMIEVIDPEREEKEELEARRQTLAAQDAENKLNIARAFKLKQTMTPYEYKALHKKWISEFGEDEAYQKALEVEKFCTIKDTLAFSTPSSSPEIQEEEPKPMHRTQEIARTKPGYRVGKKTREWAVSGRTDPSKSDLVVLDERYELTEEQAQAAQAIEQEIKRLKQGKITLSEADKILNRYEEDENKSEATVQDMEKAIKKQEEKLKNEADSEILDAIDSSEKSEALGFSSAEFKKSEQSFTEEANKFKKDHSIYPEQIGSMSKFRLRFGILLSKEERQMKEDLKIYQQVKDDFEGKIRTLLKVAPEAIKNNKAYKQLAESGRLI